MAQADVDGVRAYIDSWTAKAIELRQFKVPLATAPVHDVSEALLTVRGKLDGMEELYSNAVAMRGTVRRGEAAARDKVSDAWDGEYERRKTTGRFHTEDFRSGREKEAEINLAIRTVRTDAREMRELLDAVTECAERIRIKYFALRDIREELLQRGRAAAFESHLDRT